jgi:hypothetical protein
MHPARVALVCAIALTAPVASAEQLQMTDLKICNGWTMGFRVAVDGGLPRGIPAGDCWTQRVYVGRHAIFPKAEIFSQDWFTEAAWLLEVPAQGAVARFGSIKGLVGIVAVESGGIAGVLPTSFLPGVGEPIFLTSPTGLPGNFFQCWAPISMADVVFYHMTPLALSSNYFSTFFTAVGNVGSLGGYDINGDPSCNPLSPPTMQFLNLRADGPVFYPRVSYRAVPQAVAAKLRLALMQARLGIRPALLGRVSAASRRVGPSMRSSFSRSAPSLSSSMPTVLRH